MKSRVTYQIRGMFKFRELVFLGNPIYYGNMCNISDLGDVLIWIIMIPRKYYFYRVHFRLALGVSVGTSNPMKHYF